jgi:polyhydroxyalkanoate synthesis regulator phasin
MNRVALQLLPRSGMANDFEQLLRDVFGEPLNKLNQFQAEQVKKLQTRLQELAREAVRDELTKLHAEITEIRNRVAILEAERVRAAAESVQSSF